MCEKSSSFTAGLHSKLTIPFVFSSFANERHLTVMKEKENRMIMTQAIIDIDFPLYALFFKLTYFFPKVFDLSVRTSLPKTSHLLHSHHTNFLLEKKN